MEAVTEELIAFFRMFTILYLVLVAYILVLSIAAYILASYSLYTLAKRRDVLKPWTAWIPVANGWLIGCISDCYRMQVLGDYTQRGREILKYSIMLIISCAALNSAEVVVAAAAEAFVIIDTVFTGFFLIFALSLVLGVLIFMIVVSVRYFTRYYKALYDIFRSCQGNLGLLYFLLSLLVPFAQPICLLLSRNKDYGIPKPKDTFCEEL